MNITLSKNTTNPKKTALQKNFDKLWSEVKKQQLTNSELKTELDDLHKIYQERILPIEQLTAEPYIALAERLINFFSRKSLSKWQRYELGQWIFECIDHVQPLNPTKSHELMTSYKQVLADYLEVDIEEIEQEMHHQDDPLSNLFDEFDDLEKAFNDTARNKNKNAEFQDDLFGFADDEAIYEDSYETAEDFFADEFQEKTAEKNIFSDKWLRTIFRRTANALHPDKERNADRIKEKEELMTQLLIARDEKDVFSLLNLYMQHVDSDDLLVTDETMKNICQQLKEQKIQLTQERSQIFYENPMSAALYKSIHNNNAKKRERNIELHIQRVKESTDEFSEFVTSLRNLEILKHYLRDRYEEQRFSSIEDYRFEFDDF